MLPVVAGVAETRWQILIYSLVLLPVGVSPWLLGYAGIAYGVVATGAGLGMVVLAYRLCLAPAAAGDAVARRLFGVSILYLFTLFAMLLLERAVGLHQFGTPFGRVLA
jgi:protoheme IX farnesyltransferase